MAVMTGSTSRHAEFELATNTALSDFPNVEAKRGEQRNCLKHLVGSLDVFAKTSSRKKKKKKKKREEEEEYGEHFSPKIYTRVNIF